MRTTNETCERSLPAGAGRRALVVGLARSGLAATGALLARGWRVTVTDRRPAEELAGRAELAAELGAELELGGHREISFETADLVVVSPGVPDTVPEIEAARNAGRLVLGELELAYRASAAVFVAVTGTNGKSTTTAMIGHILSEAGWPNVVGGNIGRPLSGELDRLGPGSWAVAEVSSFQLETVAELAPRAAVLTNLAPDHLDRHGTLERYRELKLRLFARQGPEDAAVLNADDPGSVRLVIPGRARRLAFSRRQPVEAGADLRGEVLHLVRAGGSPEPLLSAAELGVPGPHNIENALAAAALAGDLGVPPAAIAEALRTFSALPHRLETVSLAGGVRYVNDSKATNVESALRALQSFTEPIIWIAGGRDKQGAFEDLAEEVRQRVKLAIYIGEARARIQAALAGCSRAILVENLSQAMEIARQRAERGDVVLLAPACASYDQYSDYEARGRHFRSLAPRDER